MQNIDLMYLKITESCNMNCPFCYVKHNNNVITKEIIQQVFQKYTPKEVVFHGGEPLLYPNIINDVINTYRYNYSITTNLMIDLNDDILKLLSKMKITTSYSKDRFNDITWNKFINNCNKVDITTVIVTITKEQLTENPYDMVKKVLLLKPKYITLERCYGNYDKEFYHKVDEYISECMDIIPDDMNTLLMDIKRSITYNQPLYNTKCSENIITINPNGSEQYCPNTKLINEPTEECLTCSLYPYCMTDCESFRGFCKFPKKTFMKYLNNKDGLMRTDNLNEWLKNNKASTNTLYEIILNVSDICNRKCYFCPRSNGYKTPHDSPFMDINVIEKICNDLGNTFNGLFSISGFGEPTLHPNLEQIVKTLQDKCPKSQIVITTNGNNYKKLLNYEGISVLFSMYEPYSEDILNELKKMKSPYKIKDIENKSKHYFNNRGGNIKYGKEITEPLRRCCNIPFYKMNIDINGDVYLCCSDWKREEIIGNIFKQNIKYIWENNYTEIRNNLLNGERDKCKLCSKCNTDGTLGGKEFVDCWRMRNVK